MTDNDWVELSFPAVEGAVAYTLCGPPGSEITISPPDPAKITTIEVYSDGTWIVNGVEYREALWRRVGNWIARRFGW